jgi:hypothetical protein
MSGQISIEARLEILDLYARQAQAIDGSDPAGWARTFTADGVFESPTYRLTATGSAELEEFAKTSNEAALARGEQLRHILDSVVMEAGQDASSIAVLAYLMIVATTAEGSRIDRMTTVHDELRRVDCAWLLAHRRVFRDAPA